LTAKSYFKAGSKLIVNCSKTVEFGSAVSGFIFSTLTNLNFNKKILSLNSGLACH